MPSAAFSRSSPPPSYVPNASLYSDVPSTFPVHSPIEQNVCGQSGVYQVLSITQPTCTAAQFIDATAAIERQRSLRELQWAADEEYSALEESYWKNIGFSRPVYGADSPGSLFDASAPWNMSRLHSLLDLIPSRIGGVTHPMLYFGTWKATFAAHVEDMNLYSINFIHLGHPKQWYGVSPASHLLFEAVIASYYPALLSCPQFLRHKDVLIKPSKLRAKGVEVVQTIQREGEFMLTFPSAYHQGYNLGFNVAESVNFATVDWLDWGLKADVCACRSSSVNIDVGEVSEKVRYIEEARQRLVDSGEADERLRSAPLSMDLVSAYPALLAALDEANAATNGRALATGQRSMVALADGVTPAVSAANSTATATISPTGEVGQRGEGADDGAFDAAAVGDEDVEEVEYHEDCIPDGVSVQLRCFYDTCDGQFRSTQALLKHCHTAHTGKNAAAKAAPASGRRRRATHSAPADEEEDEEEDFTSRKRRLSGAAKRRRGRREEEREEEEEANQDGGEREARGAATAAAPQSLREVLRKKAGQLRLAEKWKRSTDVPSPAQSVVELSGTTDEADAVQAISKHRRNAEGRTFFHCTWRRDTRKTWEPLEQVSHLLATLYPKWNDYWAEEPKVASLTATKRQSRMRATVG